MVHQTRTDRPTAHGRGQTGIDFVVGMGIFLLTIGFVVAFVPGLLTPFSDETTGPLVADRVADDLVGATLLTGPGSSTLDVESTRAFFAQDIDSVSHGLAVPSSTHLNVTVERDVPGTSRRKVLSLSADDSRLALGEPAPASGGSVSIAARVVALEDDAVVETLDNDAVVVVVRIW